MRKLRFSVIALALCLCSVSVMAQKVKENRDSDGNKIKGPYETNRFFDNLFIGVAGGVNLYTGEQDTRGDLGDRFKSPSVEAYIGKWFTPSIGGRFAYNGLQARGYTEHSFATAYDRGNGLQKFAISYLHADFMWNISNAIGGYRDNRAWSFVPFIGGGWVRTWRKSEAPEGTSTAKSGDPTYKNEFAWSVGLLNNIRLCKVMDLTIEASDMFACHELDMDASGKRMENMLSLNVGLTFKINRMFYRVRTVPDCDYTPYEEKIASLQDDVDDLNSKCDALEDENEELRNQQPEEVEKVSASPVVLFFEIGKTTLDSKEKTNLDFYVKNAIEADSDKTFTIIGSADKETGTPEINQELSEERMEYVYDILVNEYGISEDRLEKVAEGDTNNRFSEPQLNRAVIIE